MSTRLLSGTAQRRCKADCCATCSTSSHAVVAADTESNDSYKRIICPFSIRLMFHESTGFSSSVTASKPVALNAAIPESIPRNPSREHSESRLFPRAAWGPALHFPAGVLTQQNARQSCNCHHCSFCTRSAGANYRNSVDSYMYVSKCINLYKQKYFYINT